MKPIRKINPNGGAIALGHPLGASGARLALTAAYELKETGKTKALCTMCIGVGQDRPGPRGPSLRNKDINAYF